MDLRARKRELTRQQIVDAAYALFSAHGFSDTTVEMIAERAVVSPRTVYRYFPSKESIVFARLDGEADALVDAVRRRCAAGVSVPALFAAFADQLGQRQDEAGFPTLTALMRDNPPLMAQADTWRRDVMRSVAEALAELRGAPESSLEELALAGTVVTVSAIAIADWAAHDHEGDLAERILRAGRAVLDASAS